MKRLCLLGCTVFWATMALLLSGCSTGGMIQFGYLPVTEIDHNQKLRQEQRK